MTISTPTQTMQTQFNLGGDLAVNRLGYGAMRLTGQPGNFGPYADWEGGKRLLRRAVELGVNFIDTAEAYGPGENESIIADALSPYSQATVIATKGGISKPAPDRIQADGSPESLRRGVEGSLRRLQRDRIALYQLHRPDPKVPFADSVRALAALQKEGQIRHIGLSNITLEQLQAALDIVPIASVQNRFSPVDRTHEALLNFTSAEDIAFIPYGSLGAHPLKRAAPLARAEGAIARIAQQHDATPTQLALVWMLHRAPNIILIPGTTTIDHLEDNIDAASIQLSKSEFLQLDRTYLELAGG
ncbi:MAG: aldo/keto reductase [Cyanobacteria bacterium J06597_1]